MSYGLFGKMTAIRGRGDALEAHLLEAAVALEAVPDCHLYVVSRDAEDLDSLSVMEAWESPEAHQASLEMEAVQQLISLARPLLAGMGERYEFRPAGGKGLSRSA